MASINGISLKGITKFLGHEGEPLYQGNLYLNNKKIGFWSQDSWGGPDQINLDNKYSRKLLNDAVMSRNPDKAYHGGIKENPFTLEYDLDMLMFDYLSLSNDGKTFQKAVKAGYAGIIVATDGYHETSWRLPAFYTQMSDEALLKEIGPSLEEAKKSFFAETPASKHTIKIYRSPKDFTIGEPISLEEIQPKKDLNKMISSAEKLSGAPSSGQKEQKGGPER